MNKFLKLEYNYSKEVYYIGYFVDKEPVAIHYFVDGHWEKYKSITKIRSFKDILDEFKTPNNTPWQATEITEEEFFIYCI